MAEQLDPKGLVAVGRVVKPQGLKGGIQVEVYSDAPGRFSAGGFLYLNGHPHTIERSSDLSRGRIALKLDNIDSRTQAEGLRDCILAVTPDMVPPAPQGQYYHYQIMEMKVYTQEGEYLGRIAEIISTGSNDVYVVQRNGQEVMIPALDDVVIEVDVEGERMTVSLPPGLR